MKNAIVAGLIAGIVGAIVALTATYMTIPPEWQATVGFNASTMKWFATQGGLNIIWGGVFGWIYSKLYDVIPGTGVTKGLYFALGLIWVISGLFPVTFFLLVYDPPLTQMAFGWGITSFVVRIFFGSVLGYLYKK